MGITSAKISNNNSTKFVENFPCANFFQLDRLLTANMPVGERLSQELIREQAEQQSVVDEAMLAGAKEMIKMGTGDSAIEQTAAKERAKQEKKAAKKAEKEAKKAAKEEEKAFQERLVSGKLSKKERKSLEKEMEG